MNISFLKGREGLEASIAIRFFAIFFDFLILFLPLFLISKIIFPNNPEFEGAQFFTSLDTVYLIVMYLSFSFLMISIPVYWSGASPGKKMLFIRIKNINNNSSDISFSTSLMRFVSLHINLIPGVIFISIAMILFRSDKRSIHDLLSETEVVYVNNYEKMKGI